MPKDDDKKYDNKIQKAVNTAFGDDKKENTSAKFKGPLTADECWLDNCEVRTNLKEKEQEVKKLQSRLGDKDSENETLKATIQKDASNDKKQEALLKIMRDPEVRALNDTKQELQSEVEGLHKHIEDQNKKIKELQFRVDDFLNTLEKDEKFKDRFKRMKTIEERAAYLLAKETDLNRNIRGYETKQKDLELKLMKMSRAYNGKLTELEQVEEQVRNAEMILSKGIKLKKVDMKIEPIQKPSLKERLFRKLKPSKP